MEKNTKFSFPTSNTYEHTSIQLDMPKESFMKFFASFSFPFWAHFVCVFQTGLTACQSFLFCGPTFNLFQTFSVRELKCNWSRAGRAPRKGGGRSGGLCDLEWQQIGTSCKLLIWEFFLENSGSILDYILSLPEKYKLPSFWPPEPGKHKHMAGHGLCACEAGSAQPPKSTPTCSTCFSHAGWVSMTWSLTPLGTSSDSPPLSFHSLSDALG